MGKNKLTIYILGAMIAGIVVGVIINKSASPEFIESFAKNIKLLATIFIRLVQMIIAPLVFTTLVVGIAKLGDLKAVGRVGGKALGWFISASLISLLLGLMVINFFKPGVGMNLGNIDASGVEDVVGKTKGFSLQNFVEHIVPKSVVEAMATNEILQLVVFSIFFGVALAGMGEKAKPLIRAFDTIAHVVLKMVGYVMAIAPLGVFGAISAVISVRGLDILFTYAKYFSAFMVGIILLWVVLLTVGYIFLRQRLPDLLKRMYGPMVIAFSTTSSEAVFPKLTEELERFGCKDKIVSFILPLGYSFNLDGSMMYMTFASIFIAQVFNVPLTLGEQLTMLLVLMVSSKGVAGVPRASLVVVASIDHFCDMFRSMTNVLGNALATTVVSKWEGELGQPVEEV